MSCVDGLHRQQTALQDDALSQWIAREVHFFSTMVDRIVLGSCDLDREDARAVHGLEDAMPVLAEPSRDASRGVATDPSALVDRLLATPGVFGNDSPRDRLLRPDLKHAVTLAQQFGARAAVVVSASTPEAVQ